MTQAALSASYGGGRGIYCHVDGDIPMALRTNVPAQAAAHWSSIGGTSRMLCCFGSGVGPDLLDAAVHEGLRGEPGILTDRTAENRSCLEGAAPSGPPLNAQNASSVSGPMLPDSPGYFSAAHLPDTCIMHVNIQGLRSHLTELCAVIRLSAEPPDIVCVNETFLDKAVEQIELEGFKVVGRRDRSHNGDDRNCGGVIVFAKTEIADLVTLLLTSEASERMWFQIHAENGPYLLCSWYRPPVQGEVESIATFGKELDSLRNQALGTVLVGDLNLHSQRWLHYSSRNSVEGETMRKLCLELGLRQIVREPTRGYYLLDLVVTDIESANVAVSAKVADHSIVTTRLNLALPQTVAHKREVWSYSKADWDRLKTELHVTDWSFLACRDASLAAATLTQVCLQKAARYIPKRILQARKCTHPWLTDEIVQLVAAKRGATEKAEYAKCVKACSEGIMAEYNSYAARSRQALLDARRGSKQWWMLSRELLMQRTKIDSIPALRSDDGCWAHGPSGKAQLLAETFNGKNVLPESSENAYTELQRDQLQKTIKVLSERDAYKVLASLDEHSGTGPDLLPSRILKNCAKELASPVLKLALAILEMGEWPDCWKEHWMAPIYKRKAVYKPQNYRGVHLTAQISKVLERLLLLLMMPHIRLWTLSGANQFAYTKQRGARDVLALLALRWVRALDSGRKIAVYCSDVSGAFDKVSRKRLLQKMAAKGFHPKLLKLIASWLEPRKAKVVVAGACSDPFRIQDMVYQGTVLGPQLWNIYFEDAAKAIQEFLFEEVIYADDLNAFKILPGCTSNDTAIQAIDKVQVELHSWGRANQVSFDASKESKHILSKTDPLGADFKLLGIEFDTGLQMTSAVRSLVGKVRWKNKMLLRSRRSFSTMDLVLQYKQQVLSYIEYRTPGIFHATTTVLKQLDQTQDRFLLELGIDRDAALMDFNLAPLSMRRDIAVLGLLHRAALGDGPPQLREIFQRRPGSLRLVDPLDGQNPSQLMRRSIWGSVKVYNALGDSLQCGSVKDFQKHLQERAKRVVGKNLLESWWTLYSQR